MSVSSKSSSSKDLTIRPYEALVETLPEDPELWLTITDVCTGVNGFYYPGDRSDAIIKTIALLRKHPELCAALGLTSQSDAPSAK